MSISNSIKDELKKENVKGIKLVYSLNLGDASTLEKKEWDIEILPDGLVVTNKKTQDTNIIPCGGRLSYIHVMKK